VKPDIESGIIVTEPMNNWRAIPHLMKMSKLKRLL
jgi:hypothetical protein